MQDIPREKVIKRFQLLPESLQEAIFSQSGTDAVRKSCVLRDIPESKIPLVDQLTGRVLLGYLRPESFAFEIQKETGIDALKATQVAHDIDTEIFSEVRLELKKLYPPTIQTPTVQAQGFVRSQPIAAEPPKPAPRYVVPIPERFKKPEARDLKLETQNLKPEIQEEKAAPTPTPSPASSPAKASPENLTEQATAQSSEIQDSSSKIQERPPASPPMDPIVPLPTFIQSKFKQGMPEQKKGDVSGAQSAQDALKNAFGKFTAPSTATGIKKELESPYRETIEEPKKQSEQKPAAKIQGKVIDLSQF